MDWVGSGHTKWTHGQLWSHDNGPNPCTDRGILGVTLGYAKTCLYSRYSQAYSLVDSSDAMLSLAASLQQQVVLYVRGSVKFFVHSAFVLISQPDLLNLGSSKRR